MMQLESVLLLTSALATGRLLTMGFLRPFIVPGGGTLVFFLVAFIGFVVYVALSTRTTPVADRQKFFVLLASLVIPMAILSARQITIRGATDYPRASNDGVVQTEEAAKHLLHGQNPYTLDYRTTRFFYFKGPDSPRHESIAYDHYAYPPLQILLATPIQWARQTWQVYLDTQIFILVFVIAVSGLLIAHQSAWPGRSRIALLTLGNPFVWMYALAGFNDFLFAGLLILAAMSINRRWWVVAGVLFGLSVVAKQTAWLVVPLWLYWLWRIQCDTPAVRPSVIRSLLAMSAVILLVAGPFFAWNPSAFYDDVVRYISGVYPWSYPISGSTVLQYLRVWRIIDSPWSTIPVWPIQIAILIPATWWVGRWLRYRPRADQWLTSSIILILLVTLVSRFASENYFAGLIFLAAGAYALRPPENARA